MQGGGRSAGDTAPTWPRGSRTWSWGLCGDPDVDGARGACGLPRFGGERRPCTNGRQQGCQVGTVRGGAVCSSEQAALRASGCSLRLRASWLPWDLRSGNPRAEAPAPRRPVLGEPSMASRASGNPQVFYQRSFALTIPQAPCGAHAAHPTATFPVGSANTHHRAWQACAGLRVHYAQPPGALGSTAVSSRFLLGVRAWRRQGDQVAEKDGPLPPTVRT